MEETSLELGILLSALDRRTKEIADLEAKLKAAEERADEWQGFVSEITDAVDVPSGRLYDFVTSLRAQVETLTRERDQALKEGATNYQMWEASRAKLAECERDLSVTGSRCCLAEKNDRLSREGWCEANRERDAAIAERDAGREKLSELGQELVLRATYLMERTTERDAARAEVEELREAIANHKERTIVTPDYQDYQLWSAIGGAAGEGES